jgi:hypothetical protein
MKKRILLMSAILLTGCYTERAAKEKFGCKIVADTTKTDTVEVIKTDTITIPGDSVVQFLPCDEPKADPKEKKAGRASIKAKYDNGKKGYLVVANCDSLEKVIIGKDKIITTYREKIVKDAYVPNEPSTWIGKQIKKAKDSIMNLLALIGLISVLRFLWTKRNFVTGLFGIQTH